MTQKSRYHKACEHFFLYSTVKLPDKNTTGKNEIVYENENIYENSS